MTIASPVPSNVTFGSSANPAGEQVPHCMEVILASTAAALAGTSTGAQVVGPFTPQLGRPINVRLAFGSASGSVQLLRSYNASQANAVGLTALGSAIGSWVADCQEVGLVTECEFGATYWLSLPASGIAYRISQ
jgi:hypothetical protein